MPLFSALLVGLVPVTPVAWTEAENCAIVCQIQQEPGQSPLASGGRMAPNYWGQSVGDSITWRLKLDQAERRPWLAVRYAFGKAAFGRNTGSPRVFHVRVRGEDLKLVLSDTGSWGNFQIAWLQMPDLPAGDAEITLLNKEAFTNADVDCLGIFDSRHDRATAPFIPSIAARGEDARFFVRHSPNAVIERPAQYLAAFARIYGEMVKVGGWRISAPVGINIIEDPLWPNQGWSAYSNEQGCFFRASVMDRDQGNWCHEMNHVMFDGRIPKWLDESLVRIQTRLIWIERLYPEPEVAKAYMETVRAVGKRYSETPDQFESVEDVLRVLVDRFGVDLLVRFLRACSDAGAKGELDFRPNRNMTTAEVIRYFSAAVGEDVTPFFRRWRGFTEVERR